jgi:hypothetical protein
LLLWGALLGLFFTAGRLPLQQWAMFGMVFSCSCSLSLHTALYSLFGHHTKGRRWQGHFGSSEREGWQFALLFVSAAV